MRYFKNTIGTLTIVAGLFVVPSFAQTPPADSGTGPGSATAPATAPDRTAGQADRGYGSNDRGRGFDWGWLGLLGLAGLLGNRHGRTSDNDRINART